VKRRRAERQFHPVLNQPVKLGEAVSPAFCFPFVSLSKSDLAILTTRVRTLVGPLV